MSTIYRVAVSAVLTLLLGLPQAPLLAGPGGARLEGFLIDIDGRAAAGFRVHLIDSAGADIAQATTSDRGVYSFRELRPGRYSLGIENHEGKMSPVAAAPVRLTPDQLARRDIKLVRADENENENEGVDAAGKGFGIYWAGLPPGVRAASVFGIFVILGLTLSALDDESNATTVD